MEEFKSIDDILDFAISSEQEAVDLYTGLAGSARDNAMREVFESFANEERGHKTRLTRIKEERSFNFSPESITDLKIGDYLVDKEACPGMSYKDVLILAMQKEKAAFKLYTGLAEKAPNDDLRDVFLSLAQDEAKHKLRFEIEYDDNILTDN